MTAFYARSVELPPGKLCIMHSDCDDGVDIPTEQRLASNLHRPAFFDSPPSNG